MAYGEKGKIITVFSTASGVGKTLVAINMAAELANLGHSVCLIDLDLQFGDVCNYLKLSPVMTVSNAYSTLVNSPEHFEPELFLTTYSFEGVTFSVLAPVKNLTEAYDIQPSVIERIIKGLRHFDYIICDTAKKLDRLNLSVLDLSDIITFMCIADFVPAIKNLKIGYDTLYKADYNDNKIKFIQNRSDSQTLITAEDVEGVLDKPFYHNLPNDYLAAKRSVESGCPLVLSEPDNALAKSLKTLVAKYTGRYVEPKVTETKSGGFFASLRKLFD